MPPRAPAGTRVATPGPVAAVLVYGLTLVAAVLVSRLAQRTILSAALLFLAVGFLVGDGVLGIVALSPGDAPVATLVEIALFSVLFTDGMQVGLRDVRSAWRLPGRALVLGLPLTLVVTALAAWLVVGLPGLNAVLVGAALSATDPVLAAPLVGHEAVPARLRHLLNVESALNDGLALPVVIVLLATLSAVPADTVALIGDAVLGTVLGVVVPWTLIRLERTRLFGAAPLYEPLLVFAIGVVLFAVGSLSHANLFLAAFTGGATVASVSPSMRRAFRHFGETLSEILKLAAILVFGALLSPRFFTEDPVAGYGFVTLALLLARPLALSIALIGTRLDRREWIAAAWFGPKGFASVVYGLLILNAGVAGAHRMFHLIALTTTASIVAHSSTDVLVVRWFRHAVDTPDKRKLA
jgi:NhaP-type Na+/H+ or K+/H+ antiporter